MGISEAAAFGYSHPEKIMAKYNIAKSNTL
jgi:hypothetical protein